MATQSEQSTATGGSDAGIAPLEAEQRTVTQSSQITEQTGWERRIAREHSRVADSDHQQAHTKDWGKRTIQRGNEDPLDLLGRLDDLGFSWRDLAQMLHVTVPAVQKWRKGLGVSGENRRGIANLVAACDLIEENYYVSDIASWFEMPLMSGVPVTPISLYTEGHFQLLFDYASGYVDQEAILTTWDADWRDKFTSDFEVFRAEDGKLSIRAKKRD